jgi:hypothetical protein
MNLPASEVLAFTGSHGDRRYLEDCVADMRASAGYWFDWGVWLGAPSERAAGLAKELLERPDRTGIQYLTVWDENRGQHHATAEAIALARARGYKWLLRIDDDMRGKTKRWLKKMLERAEHIKNVGKDTRYRFVFGPTIKGLRNPVPAFALLQRPKDAKAVFVQVMGGGCRLHPMGLMEDYPVPLYEALGRGDPDSLSVHIASKEGALVRFEDIRLVHRTDELEASENQELAHARRMGWYWPYLGRHA